MRWPFARLAPRQDGQGGSLACLGRRRARRAGWRTIGCAGCARADAPVPEPGPNPGPDPGAGRTAWRDLPPLQRAVGAAPLTAPSAEFARDLAGRRAPDLMVAPLGHDVTADGPAGLVSGIAVPLVQRAAVNADPRSSVAAPPATRGRHRPTAQRGLTTTATLPSSGAVTDPAGMAAPEPPTDGAISAAAADPADCGRDHGSRHPRGGRPRGIPSGSHLPNAAGCAARDGHAGDRGDTRRRHHRARPGRRPRPCCGHGDVRAEDPWHEPGPRDRPMPPWWSRARPVPCRRYLRKLRPSRHRRSPRATIPDTWSRPGGLSASPGAWGSARRSPSGHRWRGGTLAGRTCPSPGSTAPRMPALTTSARPPIAHVVPAAAAASVPLPRLVVARRAPTTQPGPVAARGREPGNLPTGSGTGRPGPAGDTPAGCRRTSRSARWRPGRPDDGGSDRRRSPAPGRRRPDRRLAPRPRRRRGERRRDDHGDRGSNRAGRTIAPPGSRAPNASSGTRPGHRPDPRTGRRRRARQADDRRPGRTPCPRGPPAQHGAGRSIRAPAGAGRGDRRAAGAPGRATGRRSTASRRPADRARERTFRFERRASAGRRPDRDPGAGHRGPASTPRAQPHSRRTARPLAPFEATGASMRDDRPVVARPAHATSRGPSPAAGAALPWRARLLG